MPTKGRSGLKFVAGLATGLVLLLAVSSVILYSRTGSSTPSTFTTTLTNTSQMTLTTTALPSTVTSTLLQTVTSTQTVTKTATSPGQLGPWIQTAANFPLFIADGTSCVASGDYMYCVGGYNGTTSGNGRGQLNNTYYALLSPAGIGLWKSTTAYPTGIQDESCVASSSYIYCVGGDDAPNALTSATYYAPVSPSGIGSWTRTTAYPNPIVPRCMTDLNRIYCAGAHYSGGRFTLASGDVYSAPLSPNGIGTWTASPRLPTGTAGCSASGGYAYCFGGGNCPPPSDCPSPSYYAPLLSGGTGNWTRTTDLPTAGWAHYVAAVSYVYYMAGPKNYYAHLSSDGIGPWAQTTPYPLDSPGSCVSVGIYIYCVGGSYSNKAYFTQVGT